MSKKEFAPIVAIIILLVAGGIAGYTLMKNKQSNKETITTTITKPNITSTTIASNSVPPTTPSQKAKMFKCGDSVTFTYKGAPVTYGTVLHNSVCWLDRNLGASRVATSQTDSVAYGDLFQWGRLDDGHQTRTSGTTTNLSSSDNPGHANFINFIYATSSPYDWRSPQNNNLWQGVNGINNPCPSGWRIPTSEEWNTEQARWSQQNYSGAFASLLKLPAGGYRNLNGSLYNVGSVGYYWSSTVVDDTNAYYLYFNSSNLYLVLDNRGYGFSVRCIKN